MRLRDLTPAALDKLHEAFVGLGLRILRILVLRRSGEISHGTIRRGERAYGAVAITGIPNYAELKQDAFRAGTIPRDLSVDLLNLTV